MASSSFGKFTLQDPFASMGLYAAVGILAILLSACAVYGYAAW